jgi:hypothetical protein
LIKVGVVILPCMHNEVQNRCRYCSAALPRNSTEARLN